MDNALKREYENKYVRTGSQIMVPAAQNPIPQMKYDSVKLRSTPDFGGLGTAIDWQYISAPATVRPITESGSERYITFLGGDQTNQLDLHATVEITIGRDEGDLHVFSFTRVVSAHIEKGMLFGVRVTAVDDPDVPVQYNEFDFGSL
jgi:hypothetical protein